MIGPRTFINYAFQISAWSIILSSVGMIIAASADISLGFGWGFTSKDIFMAIVVLVGAIIVKLIGTKIIIAFGSI